MKKTILIIVISLLVVAAGSTALIIGLNNNKADDECTHQWSEWNVTVEATCAKEGSQERECLKCKIKQTETIDTLEHTLTVHEAKEATCTDVGWNSYETCSECDYTTYQEIQVTEHDKVVDQAVEATHGQTGLTEGEHCAVCGEIFVAQQVIPALYYLNVNVNSNVFGSAYGAATASEAELRTVRATEEEGYNFFGWFDGDKLVSKDTEYTFNMPGNDYTLTARFTSQDFTDISVWDGSITTGFVGGSGTESDPYLISTGAELSYLATEINSNSENTLYDKYYSLINSIDLDGREWNPIGCLYTGSGMTDASPTQVFSGVFDGNGYVISNFKITTPEHSYYMGFGLFGYAMSATIKNLGVENFKIEILNHSNMITVGGICGFLAAGTISNCYTKGNISASSLDEVSAGGIVGFIDTGTITGCYSTSNINASCPNTGAAYTGGIIGNAGNYSEVSYSYATGDVSSSGEKNTYTGGLIGLLSDNVNLDNCYATGSVSSNSTSVNTRYGVYAGGLIGYLEENEVKNSFATGNVRITFLEEISANAYAAELIGYVEKEVTITNSYRFASQIISKNSVIESSNSYGIEGVVANLNSKEFYTETLLWSEEIWDFIGEDGTLSQMPQLIKISSDMEIEVPLIRIVGEYYYQLFIESEANGTISAKEAIIRYGFGINLIATPNEGYLFGEWNEDGNPLSNLEQLFYLPTSSTTLQAKYENLDYSVNAYASYSTITVAGSGTEYHYQEEITLTAENVEGYTFIGWYLEDIQQSTDLIYSFNMPSKNISVEARYYKNYTLSVNSNSNTFGSVEGASIAYETESCTVKATESANYLFFGWFNGDKLVSKDAEYTFIMPSDDYTLTARFTSQDFTDIDVWDGTIATGFAGGRGTENEPYLISTGSELAYLATEINTNENNTLYDKYYSLTNSIDLDGREWDPIGCYSFAAGNNYSNSRTFAGVFDGNDFVIFNYKITTPKQSYYKIFGLFGCCKDGTIINLGVENFIIDLSSEIDIFAGGLVAYAANVTITNSYAIGSVSIGEAINVYAGVLVGAIENNTTLSNSYAKGEVSLSGIDDDFGGGLVGAANKSTITNCYATSNVSANSSAVAYSCALGGLVGYVNENIIITDCYATGNVSASGNGNCFGGFIGHFFDGIVTNCYATGNVNITSDDEIYLGGFVGFSNLGKFINCFAIGNVSLITTLTNPTTYGIGGFEGMVGSDATITNCYYFEEQTITINGVPLSNEQVSIESGIANLNIKEFYTETLHWNEEIWDFTGLTDTIKKMPQIVENINNIIIRPLIRISGENYYQLFFESETNGTIDLANAIVQAGFGIKLIATPNDGYHFAGWYEGETLLSTAEQFFYVPNSSTEIIARYYKDYELFLESNVDDFGSVDGAGIVYETQSYTIKATPNDGYKFFGWFEGDKLVSKDAEYTFNMPSSDYTLVARFTAQDNVGIINWNGSIATGFTGGSGTESDPYLISTGAELAYLASEINSNSENTLYDKYYRLTNSINLSGLKWNPIGCYYNETGSQSENRAFCGVFDGNGYVISNYKITEPRQSHYISFGLFGVTLGATILNLGVEDFTVDLNSIEGAYIGGLSGAAVGSIINNCYTTGTINVVAIAAYAGGLIGFLEENISVTACYAAVDVKTSTAAMNTAGGLVGAVASCKTITNCYATGNVNSIGLEIDLSGYSNQYQNFIGGLIGTLTFCEQIDKCYATGDVSYDASNTAAPAYSCAIGGLIGMLGESLSVTNCYATGEISINAASNTSQLCYNYAGGLIAFIQRQVETIANCYATGNISMDCSNSANTNCVAAAGGLIGVCGYLELINSFVTGNISIISPGNDELLHVIGASELIIAQEDVTVSNCYYSEEQTIKINNELSPSGQYGTKCLSAQFTMKGFYTETLIWSEEIWDFAGVEEMVSKMPQLIIDSYEVESEPSLVGAVGENYYQLFLESGQNGTINVTEAIVQYGFGIGLIATPDAGYHLVGWYEEGNDGDVLLSDSEKFFYIPTGPFKTIKAVFAISEYSIDVYASDDEIDISDKSSTGNHYQDQIVLTADDVEGYTFVGWYINGRLVSSEKTYSFSMPTENILIEARYNKQLSLTVLANSNTFGSVEGSAIVYKNDTCTVNATPKQGYVFIGWFADDVLLSKDVEFTFDMPSDDYTVVARFTAFDNVGINVWDGSIATGFARGSGTVSDPYLISTGAELAYLASEINSSDENTLYDKYYRLMNLINLNGLEWDPIGCNYNETGSQSDNRRFYGVFDGNGFIIYNYKITSPKQSYYQNFGLFGYCYGATIKNLGVEDFAIDLNTSVNAYVGGLVGDMNGTKITNCYTTGNIAVSCNAGAVGGLVGDTSFTCPITNCYTTVNLNTSSSRNVGGLVGSIPQWATITNCYATGNVSAINANHVGGFVGIVDGKIINCYATGDVTINGGANGGGFAGYSYSMGNFTNCLATGDVTFTNGGLAGGFIGTHSSNAKFTNCYRYVNQVIKINEVVGATNTTGTECSISNLNSKAFYTETLLWSEDAWNFNTLNYNLGQMPQPVMTIDSIETALSTVTKVGEKYYQLFIASNGNGTVNITEAIVQDRYSIELIAVSASGYRFVGWYMNGKLLSDSEQFLYAANSSGNISAIFELIS